MSKKPDGMIGMSVAAGKVAFGSEEAVNSVRRGRARLVIVATDASDRTKKLMYNNPYLIYCQNSIKQLGNYCP